MEPDNPYLPPNAIRTPTGSRWSRAVACAFLCIAALPTCLMLYWLSQHFIALYGSPTQSYRPIIVGVGMAITLLTFVLGTPLLLIIKQFIGSSEHELLSLFYCIAGLPAVLGIVGPFFIVWATGSSFGS